MTYYTPYPTERGWRFRCCMNAESEPFDSRYKCSEAAASEERRDRWIAKQPGLRGDIYRAAFEAMNVHVDASADKKTQPKKSNV